MWYRDMKQEKLVRYCEDLTLKAWERGEGWAEWSRVWLCQVGTWAVQKGCGGSLGSSCYPWAGHHPQPRYQRRGSEFSLCREMVWVIGHICEYLAGNFRVRNWRVVGSWKIRYRVPPWRKKEKLVSLTGYLWSFKRVRNPSKEGTRF